MVWALGNAGTQASGLWEFNADGAMSKHLHAGRAAANGVLSALLAERGFTGAPSILEGDRGFFRATAPDADPGEVVLGLGDSSPLKIHGVSLKPHASCRHTHAAIDCALELRPRSGSQTIESIEVADLRRDARPLRSAAALRLPTRPNSACSTASPRRFYAGRPDSELSERSQSAIRGVRELVSKVNARVAPANRSPLPARVAREGRGSARERRDARGRDHAPQGGSGISLEPGRDREQVSLARRLRRARTGAARAASRLGPLECVEAGPG